MDDVPAVYETALPRGVRDKVQHRDGAAQKIVTTCCYEPVWTTQSYKICNRVVERQQALRAGASRNQVLPAAGNVVVRSLHLHLELLPRSDGELSCAVPRLVVLRPKCGCRARKSLACRCATTSAKEQQHRRQRHGLQSGALPRFAIKSRTRRAGWS